MIFSHCFANPRAKQPLMNGRSSDLTHFPAPSRTKQTFSGKSFARKAIRSITAAGLSGLFTLFPFNPHGQDSLYGTNSLQR